jgi:hypothetical protein
MSEVVPTDSAGL